jgi:hypothetical protein
VHQFGDLHADLQRRARLARKNLTTAAKPLDCEYAIPPPPRGQSFDKEKVNVDLTVNGAVSVAFGCTRRPVSVPK